MRIAIFGLGYVGCTTAACVASQGHEVIGFDVSSAKVDALAAGKSLIREPKVDELLSLAKDAGRLTASMAIGDALASCDLAIVCVGTSSGSDGVHDMSSIVQVTRAIAAAVSPTRAHPLTVAYRSTMRPGATEQVIAPIFRARLQGQFDAAVELVYNPEFLREGTAVDDYFAPPKIVIGTKAGARSATMDTLHSAFAAPVFYLGYREAEFTKFVDNSWHAVKVAFANEIGRICQPLNVSAAAVHEVFVSDTKLNISPNYLQPGDAFGGSCLPKDVRALQHLAGEVGADAYLIDALLRSNEAHKRYQYERATEGLRPNAAILLVGLAFKPDTDDLRESPAVDLARHLLDAGHRLDVYDPALAPERLIGQSLGYACSHLPTIDTLLIDRAAVESRRYDLVLATNHLARGLRVDAARSIDLSVIP